MADLSLFQQLAASCATMLPLLAKEEQEEARMMVSRMLIKEDKAYLHQDDLKLEKVSGTEMDLQRKNMLEEVKEVGMEVKKMVEEERMDANLCDMKVDVKEKPSFWLEEWDFPQVTFTSLQDSEAESRPEKDESSPNKKESELTISSLPDLTITRLEDSGAESWPGKVESNQNESEFTIASFSQPESKGEERESTREEGKVELDLAETAAEEENCTKELNNLEQDEAIVKEEVKSESRWWRKRKSIDVFEGSVQEIGNPRKKRKTSQGGN